MKKSLRFDACRWNRRLDTTAAVWGVSVIASSITVTDDASDIETAFDADKVSYFDRFANERSSRRWPRLDYRLLGLQTRPVPGRTDEVEVRFRLQFAVSNGRSSVFGTTDNAFRIETAPKGPRSVALRERRVRDQEA